MAVTLASPRLRGAAVPMLPAQTRPLLLPGAVKAGILHIGLGAFHRAHQAVYTEEAIATSGGDWGIAAVAPRSRSLVDVLAEQDHLFSVASLGPDGSLTRAVGSLVGAYHLPSHAREILALFADPAIRIVTLTVTEKAYRVDDEVRADLSSGRDPRTVPGLLGRGLREREAAGGPPIAILCCDNLPANGAWLRDLVGRITDGGFGPWVSYPSTMIDRIVPASTERTLERARLALGVADLAAVEAEPYRQWVIEDSFPGGRPDWGAAGAVLTDDVTAWEQLKLRVLNGVHSTLAYLGALAGRRTIAEALALPGMRTFLTRFVEEDVAPTLDPPPGVSIIDYGQSVLERFANPAIEHRTLQIAMDGSQKLPQRLLSTIVDRRRTGGMPRHAALAVAAWMRFVQGAADDGRPLPLDDPMADAIRAAVPTSDDPHRTVRALLGLFPDRPDDPELVDVIAEWLRTLGKHGAASTVVQT